MPAHGTPDNPHNLPFPGAAKPKTKAKRKATPKPRVANTMPASAKKAPKPRTRKPGAK